MLKVASARPEISVVIPCYNEEENAAAIAAAVVEHLERVTKDYDLIFIDNASTDRTVEIIRGLCASNPRVKLIINTRNFGQMRSPTHGIMQARGRAIISLCADFEDPPELIPQFVDAWRQGSDVVLGVSEVRQVTPLFAAARRVSYGLQRRFGDYPIIPNATGFGLYDSKVVRSIEELNEPEPFFRGLLVETGYSIKTIPFVRRRRVAGRSKNGFLALLDFALSGLAGSSKGLLRVPLYVSFFAFFFTGFSLLGGIYSMAVGENARMWFFAALLEAQFALLFLFFGLIGVQIRAISDRTRGTPLVIERERVNFPAED